jgi:P-type Ca2+ transporter type 2C
MTAVSMVVLEHSAQGDPIVAEHTVEGYSYSPIGKVGGVLSNEEVHDQPLGAVADIAAVCALCNDARIIGNDGAENSEIEEEKVNETGQAILGNQTTTKTNDRRTGKKKTKGPEKTYERVGEPTEAALCVLTEKLGGMSHYLEGGHFDRKGLHFNVPSSVLASANVNSWRKLHPRLATLEFNRDRKSMSVLCAFPKGDYPTGSGLHDGVKSRKAGNRLLVKGAPNLLIERCTHVKFRDGTVSKITGKLRREIEQKVSELATRPLRCIALAVKESNQLEESISRFNPQDDRDVARHPLLSNSDNYRNIESGLMLVGIVGIKDPARPGVAESIDICTKAGIRVLMITGDAKDTGKFELLLLTKILVPAHKVSISCASGCDCKGCSHISAGPRGKYKASKGV